MIQIKKTILTLVALLAVTTGAWADETPLLTIENKDYASFKSGSMTFDDMVTVTFSNEVKNYGSTTGWFSSTGSLLTVAGTNGYTITSCKFYTDAGIAAIGYTVEGESPSVFLSEGYVYTDNSKSVNIGEPGVKKIEVYGTAPSASSATPVDIAWDAETKTGTFKQPAGNVTVSVEYYPLATLAFQGLTAAEDAAAKTEAPLAVVADGAVTGGTLMYYVAPDENFSQADAIALAETAWSAAIPTAETVDAAGTCYVWYYIKGDAEHSDTDPKPLAVTLLPEPTYTVEFAEGTPESGEWKAEPAADVKKGQTVTVTYTGSKKVLGVKAEKKAKAPATVLSGALVDGAIIKVNVKWRGQNSGDYVQGVYNAASGTFTVSKGGNSWGSDNRAMYKVEKSGDNIIIGAGFYNYNEEGMVWTFNTTNDTYTTTNGSWIDGDYGLISVTLNGTNITSQLTAQ